MEGARPAAIENDGYYLRPLNIYDSVKSVLNLPKLPPLGERVVERLTSFVRDPHNRFLTLTTLANTLACAVLCLMVSPRYFPKTSPWAIVISSVGGTLLQVFMRYVSPEVILRNHRIAIVMVSVLGGGIVSYLWCSMAPISVSLEALFKISLGQIVSAFFMEGTFCSAFPPFTDNFFVNPTLSDHSQREISLSDVERQHKKYNGDPEAWKALSCEKLVDKVKLFYLCRCPSLPMVGAPPKFWDNIWDIFVQKEFLNSNCHKSVQRPAKFENPRSDTQKGWIRELLLSCPGESVSFLVLLNCLADRDHTVEWNCFIKASIERHMCDDFLGEVSTGKLLSQEVRKENVARLIIKEFKDRPWLCDKLKNMQEMEGLMVRMCEKYSMELPTCFCNLEKSKEMFEIEKTKLRDIVKDCKACKEKANIREKFLKDLKKKMEECKSISGRLIGDVVESRKNLEEGYSSNNSKLEVFIAELQKKIDDLDFNKELKRHTAWENNCSARQKVKNLEESLEGYKEVVKAIQEDDLGYEVDLVKFLKKVKEEIKDSKPVVAMVETAVKDFELSQLFYGNAGNPLQRKKKSFSTFDISTPQKGK